MPDNITLPASGEVAATDEIGGRHFQLVKLAFGADGVATLVELSAGLPVAGPLTDAQMRATPLPVSGIVATAGRGVILTDRSGTIATNGQAQQMAPANAARTGMMLQNHSAGDLWVDSLSTAVQSQPSVRIPPGAMYEWPSTGVPTTAVSVIGATAGQTFTAREW